VPEGSPDDITRSHIQLAHDTLVGHYRIVEKIGAGGMGEVYLAEDTELNRKVALKFLPSHLCQDADCRARFKREAQAAAKLDHPNIVSVFEVGEFQDRPFFSMQHVEGQSLKEVLAGKSLPLDRIVELAIQVCDGLQAAHESGITHRDIKPSNILIDSHGRARIVDFGLASVLGTEPLTRTGSTLGTIGYMSPEQVRGDKVDHRTDLFSFGVVLYEMLTGHAPFAAETEAATLHAITNAKPELLARYRREVPAELQTIVDKALEKNVATRYQHADELLADLKRLTSTASVVPNLRRRRLRVIVPSLLILGLVVTALLLRPWRFEVSPTQESQASANWLAVMYFDNIADPEDSKRLGAIATNLLSTGLSQSEYIRVVSSQRLYDLLKQVGKEGAKTIDRATASQIAKKAEAKWMLTGSILQSEPVLVLTSQLIDVSSGGVLASQRITGNEGENIFAVIDRLTEEVRRSSSLPAAMRSEPSVQVADVTTHSQEAYRYYLEGLEYSDKMYFTEARRSFLKAVELDSTFASAYLELGEEYLPKAVQYAHRASDRDRRLIQISSKISSTWDGPLALREFREYLTRYPDDKKSWWVYGYGYSRVFGGRADSALLFIDRAIELDSTYPTPYNFMAYIYGDLGKYDKALAAIDKYIELAPDQANPYDTRGDLYASAGQLDSAIESYRQALLKKPDYDASIDKLGCMYLLAGQFERADSMYRANITAFDISVRGVARGWLVAIPAGQGRFREALRLADDCIAANSLDGMNVANIKLIAIKGDYFDYLGMRDSALTNTRISEDLAVRLTPWDTTREWRIGLYYRAGDTARAVGMLQRLSVFSSSGFSALAANYWQQAGEIALARKDFAHAIEYLSRADSTYVWQFANYRLAEAYLESGDASGARKVLEKLLKDYYELGQSSPYIGATAHYLLGRAYEGTGDARKARAAYEEFLTIWKDADPGLKDVEDAKARLTRLKASS
jgi:serine/threonine protein kinase/Flp pilus assembly protein TadD